MQGSTRERLCGNRGRYWSDAVTSQGTPRTAGHPQTLRERHESDSPSETPEAISPTDTLILNFSPPAWWKNDFLLCYATQFMVLSYSSPRKLIHYLVPPISVWEQDAVHIFKRHHRIMEQSENCNACFSTSLDADQWILLTSNVCKIFVYLKSFYSVCQIGRAIKLFLLLKA